MKKIALMVSLVVAAMCVAEPMDVERFFSNPEASQFRISPDGRYVAGLIPYEGYMNVVVFDLETRTPRMLSGQKTDVTRMFWVSNDRIFYGINQGEATLSNSRTAGSIFGVDADGNNHKVMVKSWLERRQSFGEKVKGMIGVLHAFPSEPEHVLVTRNDRRSEYPDLYLMHIRSGKLKKVSNNPGYVTDYFVDEKTGKVLGGLWWEDTESRKAAVYTVDYRDDSDLKGEWRKLMDIPDIMEAPGFVGLSEDGSFFYISKNNEAGFKSLYSIDLKSNELNETLVLEDPEYDIDTDYPLLGLKSKRVVGVRYERDKPVNHYLDETYAKFAKMIDEAIPNAHNTVIDTDAVGNRVVIESISDEKSPEHFLLDLAAGTMEPLGEVFPKLKGVYFPDQMPVKYQARDGRTIHGYLYLPEGYQKGTPVPMIVNPHGGPWARDTWGVRWWFDIEPLFLVSRGFAVLKVNFRSSTGYGDDHYRSSFKKWDDVMNDIYDGVKWAIEQGYADPEKVGIMGASFGGYATMTAVAKQPDMFSFGVNFFGVIDVPEQIETYYDWDRDLAAEAWKERVGDPSVPEEKSKLDEWSAINYLDQIKVPLFLYHGLADTLVDIGQTRKLVSGLKKLDWEEGKDYVLTYDTDEGHGAYNASKRIELYRKLDDFLKPWAPAWQFVQ